MKIICFLFSCNTWLLQLIRSVKIRCQKYYTKVEKLGDKSTTPKVESSGVLGVKKLGLKKKGITNY